MTRYEVAGHRIRRSIQAIGKGVRIVTEPTIRNIWRFYSTNAVGALVAWNMMPSVLEIYIPWPWHPLISAVLFAAFIIARLIPQPKLEKSDVG